jgi:hypothetical protein
MMARAGRPGPAGEARAARGAAMTIGFAACRDGLPDHWLFSSNWNSFGLSCATSAVSVVEAL